MSTQLISNLTELSSTINSKIALKDYETTSVTFQPGKSYLFDNVISVSGYHRISVAVTTVAGSEADALWFTSSLCARDNWIIVTNCNPSATYTGKLSVRLFLAKKPLDVLS